VVSRGRDTTSFVRNLFPKKYFVKFFILFRKRRKALLEGVKDFTIMLKNSVEFPDCGKDLHQRNILENMTKSYLSTCIYNKENDTLCPIFKLGDIIEWSGSNFSEVAFTVRGNKIIGR
jgi:hypothetical protein